MPGGTHSTLDGTADDDVLQTYRDPPVGSPATIYDIITGEGGHDTLTDVLGHGASLYGQGGDDILNGGAGADLLHGGPGRDALYGGGGNDILQITSVYDVAPGEIYDGGAGVDTLNYNSEFSLKLYNLTVTSVEKLFDHHQSGVILTAAQLDEFSVIRAGDITVTTAGSINLSHADLWVTAITLVSGDRLNLTGVSHSVLVMGGGGPGGSGVTIIGGDGDDSLSGSGDNNLIEGGPGNDRLDGGGGGNDIASYRHAPSAVMVDLSLQNSLDDTGGAGVDALTNFAGLMGSRFDDTLAGDGHANKLIGGGGDDILLGGTGSDVLKGGAGDDTLDGGEGTSDAANFGGATPVTVSLLVVGPQDTGLGFDTLIGIENLAGGSGDDVLTGNGGANQLRGGGGADVLTGDGGADRFVYETVSESHGAAHDVITDFEDGIDKIDLRKVDAVAGQSEDQAFSWIGSASFAGHAGELRYALDGAGHTIIDGDVNGDGNADFELLLDGAHSLTAGDFLL